MGQVYRAFDARLERRVALKILHACPSSAGATPGTVPGVAAILHEARAAAAALDHPHAVLHALRGRRAGRHPVPGHGGALRRHVAPRLRRARGSADRAARALARRHRPRPRRGARRGDRPPRHQARQRHRARRRGGQGARLLRHRPAAHRPRRTEGARGRRGGAARLDQRQHVRRDSRLHGARAGEGTRRRREDGSVCLGRARLRAALRPQALAGGPRGRGAPLGDRDGSRAAPRPRRSRRRGRAAPSAGEAARRPVPHHGGGRGRARRRLRHRAPRRAAHAARAARALGVPARGSHRDDPAARPGHRPRCADPARGPSADAGPANGPRALRWLSAAALGAAVPALALAWAAFSPGHAAWLRTPERGPRRGRAQRRSESASPAPTTLESLPPPQGCQDSARPEYEAGLHALHEGAWERARARFPACGRGRSRLRRSADAAGDDDPSLGPRRQGARGVLARPGSAGDAERARSAPARRLRAPRPAGSRRPAGERRALHGGLGAVPRRRGAGAPGRPLRRHLRSGRRAGERAAGRRPRSGLPGRLGDDGRPPRVAGPDGRSAGRAREVPAGRAERGGLREGARRHAAQRRPVRRDGGRGPAVDRPRPRDRLRRLPRAGPGARSAPAGRRRPSRRRWRQALAQCSPPRIPAGATSPTSGRSSRSSRATSTPPSASLGISIGRWRATRPSTPT